MDLCGVLCSIHRLIPLSPRFIYFSAKFYALQGSWKIQEGHLKYGDEIDKGHMLCYWLREELHVFCKLTWPHVCICSAMSWTLTDYAGMQRAVINLVNHVTPAEFRKLDRVPNSFLPPFLVG